MSVFCGVGLVLCLTGCGQRSPGDRLPTFPVRGVVLHDGQPADGAQVIFHSKEEQGLQAEARTDAFGAFELSTYETGDGAPAGAYAVTVIWLKPAEQPTDPDPEPIGLDVFKGKYANPEQPVVEVSVTDGDNRLDPIVLD